MKNNYVVYEHLKPNGEIFYIGIGRPSRPYYKNGRNKYWNNIVNKYGYKVNIIHKNLSWELACEIEIHLIKFYGRKDLKLGKLCNLTDGGDKRTFTEEQKLQLSISNIGKKHNFKSIETLENSKKTRFKKGSTVNNKKVINTETGEIYDSAKDCHILTKSIYSRNHFRDMISGSKTNKTIFKYLKDI